MKVGCVRVGCTPDQLRAVGSWLRALPVTVETLLGGPVDHQQHSRLVARLKGAANGGSTNVQLLRTQANSVAVHVDAAIVRGEHVPAAIHAFATACRDATGKHRGRPRLAPS